MTQRLVRSAEPVVTHKHKKNVRFEINKRVNDNNDDDNNKERDGNGLGVGMC